MICWTTFKGSVGRDSRSSNGKNQNLRRLIAPTNMNIESLKSKVRYLTNQQGKTTDVLIPLDTWETILRALDIETETDSKTELIADLKQSLLDAQLGKTFPLEELWEGIEE